MTQNLGRRLAIGVLALGLLSFASPAHAASATRTSSFAYDPASGLLTQEVVEPSTPALRLEKDTIYDAYGNKTSVSVVGTDIVTRTSGSTYDAKGQFATTLTNALSQQETWAYDARFGAPTSHTGPNGLTSTVQYDGFGRKTLEIHEDGTQASYQYAYCSGVNGGTIACPTYGAYAVTVTPLASDGATQNGPISITYLDTLDRKIESATQGFDGSVIVAVAQYDALGRVAQASRPYFAATGTPKWTVMTYDVLSRVTMTTHPDGSQSLIAYHGLSMMATNGLGQTQTQVKNSQGEVVSVTDALSHSSTYAYDPFANLVSVTDPVGNVATFTYDTRGRKTAMTDPDMGTWSYTYDTASEVVSQTDAKGQTKTFAYDKLGRLTQRVEPGATCTWTYDTQPKGIGKLATASNNNGYSRTQSYDSLGRPSLVSITADSTTPAYSIATAYDANGRVSQVTYPSGFVATYTYNSLGYTSQLSSGSQVYWQANTLDAEGHLTQQTYGNGVVTNEGFDANTGRLVTIGAGTGNTVENASYGYDVLGNLTSRVDSIDNVSESFAFDSLNRLTTASILNVTSSVSSASTADPFANLTWGYGAPGGTQPHAVLSLTGGTTNASFTYDNNGNQTAGLGRTIAYTSYNKPASIAQGTTTLTFTDDTEHQRVKQVAPEGTTLYLRDTMGSGLLVEQFASGTVQWNEYLVVAGQVVGVHFNHAGGSVQTRYFHKDNLGSVVALTDETGAVVQRVSYDVWGKIRYASGSPDSTNSIASQTTRAFIGEERLADVGLVHLNARVYDPVVGHFTSADGMVESPYSTQGWNRYAYAGNNPVSFSDPGGQCFLGCFWKPIISALTGFQKSIIKAIVSVPIVNSIIQIAVAVAATAACDGVVACGIAASAGYSAFVSGVTSGKLGVALKAGLITVGTAAAFYGVGDATSSVFPSSSASDFGSNAFFFNVAGHAAVGCASAAAAGGDCGPGALAAGIPAAAGPVIGDQGFVGNLIASAVIGGLSSVAGGGKFANGAETAAFGYLFNAAFHPGPALVGIDAHQVLLNYLRSGVDGAQWTGNVGLGGLFGGGRPDLLYLLPDNVNYSGWEIKPIGQDAAAVTQLQRYIDVPGSRLSPGDNTLIFGGASTLTLNSNWFLGRTTYTYYSGAPGAVTYSVNDKSVFQQIFQVYKQRPAGSPSPLPLPVPLPIP